MKKFKNDINTNSEKPLELLEVPIENIRANPNQPRRSFDEESLLELARSICSAGLLHPPLVKPINEGFYELISGERRLRAAKIAKLPRIPVLIRALNKDRSAEAALIENIQRKDLNSLEIAKSIQKLMSEFNLNQQEIESRIGMKRSTACNYLRLLSLPETIQKALKFSHISMGHAKAILSLSSDTDRMALFRKIQKQNLNVRESERLAQQPSRQKAKTNSGKTRTNVHLHAFREFLQEKLGTKVVVQGNENKGKIMIDYYSLEDLNRLAELLEAVNNI